MEMIIYITLLGIVLLTLYLFVIRPWQLQWGATDEEVARSLPGDANVKQPSFAATRAVTIRAMPSAIWPWLIQIGTKRAGFYSLIWIDNAGIHSSEKIIPELQHIEVGDFIPMTPDGKQGMWVKEFDPQKYILWRDKDGRSTWLWQLLPQDDGSTRLITRMRVRYDWTLPWVLYYLVGDVGDIVMMSKCMLGIKRRAENVVLAA